MAITLPQHYVIVVLDWLQLVRLIYVKKMISKINYFQERFYFWSNIQKIKTNYLALYYFGVNK